MSNSSINSNNYIVKDFIPPSDYLNHLIGVYESRKTTYERDIYVPLPIGKNGKMASVDISFQDSHFYSS